MSSPVTTTMVVSVVTSVPLINLRIGNTLSIIRNYRDLTTNEFR